MKRGLTALGLLLALAAHAAPGDEPRARRAVLMIGDGMGLGQVTAGMIAAGGTLQLDRFPVVGLSRTRASDNLVTDSAAAATAMASGVKTYNGAIGVDSEKRPVPTLVELARAGGLATGVVVTCSVTHATPAAFLAHQDSRRLDDAIALDIARSGLDVLIGGGRKFFSVRADGRDLLAEMRAQGVSVVDDLARIDPSAAGSLLALVADQHLPRIGEGRGDYLPRAAAMALELLGRRERSFLMVEGSQIDWGSHDNAAAYAVAEMLDFDAAIGRVRAWAEQDGHTLVVVTGDHETGGLAIHGGSLVEKTVTAAFTTKGHTGVMVPVFAYGPGAEAFAGVYENTEIFHRLKAALGL
jgi:alkaline phosphatase